MSNVLDEEKLQQVIALGRLGWSLRRIERHTGVRLETAGTYLKAAESPCVVQVGGDDQARQPQPMSHPAIRLRQNRPMK